MSSRNRNMSKSASAYAADPRLGSIPTATGNRHAASGSHTGQTLSDSPSRISGPPTPLSYERIAERARALWLASGCLPGRDEQNWREAEAQLEAEPSPE